MKLKTIIVIVLIHKLCMCKLDYTTLDYDKKKK